MLVRLQATLAYLETNRDTIASGRSWWLFTRIQRVGTKGGSRDAARSGWGDEAEVAELRV
jgi:hypothetical protein